MAAYLSNAFSLQMLSNLDSTLHVEEMALSRVQFLAQAQNAISCVGHADMASVMSDQLGFDVPVNRVSVTLNPGDSLYVCQLTGGRLPAGATTLPSGFSVTWVRVVA